MQKPSPPEFPRTVGGDSGTRSRTGSASLLLQATAWGEYNLAVLVYHGVITEEEASAVTFQVSPQLLGKDAAGGVLMPCRANIPRSTWEKIAAWHQKPHRELDPYKPGFHDAVAARLALYHGEDNKQVIEHRARADELRQQPEKDPFRISKVKIESRRIRGDLS